MEASLPLLTMEVLLNFLGGDAVWGATLNPTHLQPLH